MNKKQWVAPSAELVTFAGNEYISTCYHLTSIGAVNNQRLLVDTDNNGELSLGDPFKGSYYYSQNDNEVLVNSNNAPNQNTNNFQDYFAHVTQTNTNLEDQRLERGTSNWLSGGVEKVVNDLSGLVSGFLASFNRQQNNKWNGTATDAYIWYGSEEKSYHGNTWTDYGYYVATGYNTSGKS